MRKVFRCSACLLALLASTALLTCACDGSTTAPPSGTSAETAATETASPGDTAEQSYKITVQNTDGTPASDVIVKLWKDGTEAAFKLVGPTGSVTFKVPAADYTVTAETPAGQTLHVTPEDARLTPSAPELTLTIFTSATHTQPLSAPSKKGDYAHFDAASVGEGSTYIPFVAGDHTYVIFTPTRPGIYEIGFESGQDVEISYHGAPINVFDTPLLDTVDGKITLPISAGSVGDTPDTTAQFVFRLNGTGGGCLFTVTRTGDVPKSPYDEPWTVPTAPVEALKPYEGITDGTLTDLDVTDPSLTVVLGEDGYYHYGSADGPVVFLRIASPNPYMSDFKTICDSTRICAYLYNEDGSFDRRISYNELIAEYLTVASEDGVVPLNEQLADMVKTAGNYMGWWNFSEDLDIFDDKIVDPAVAWLFACAYYR